jgi:hypothetical protein
MNHIGMPDPATIDKQKSAYTKMLDEQFKQGTQVTNKSTIIRTTK